MSHYTEPVGSMLRNADWELNRLAGTLVNDQPTLGQATAALWWLGHHRELYWAPDNMCSPNQATGGMATKDSAGFVGLDGQTLEVVEGEPVIGNLVLQITSVPQPRPKIISPDPDTTEVRMENSTIAFEDPFPVKPMHLYTSSVYTRKEPGGDSPSRANWMSLHWFDAHAALISSFEGDFHVSKEEWNLTWVTSHAPENAVTCRVAIRWEQMPGEKFSIDKGMFYNGTDPQAWAYPAHGAADLRAGLRAHLNMKAGIFNPEEFVSATEAVNRMARAAVSPGVRKLRGNEVFDLASALSIIPTPDPNVVG